MLVSAEFPRMPPKCDLCGDYGHLGLRCPSTIAPPVSLGSKVVQLSTIPVLIAPSPIVEASLLIPKFTEPVVASSQPFLDIPVTTIASEDSSSGGWLRVVRKSKPPQTQFGLTSPIIQPVTSSQFDDEEELIKAVQQIIQNHIAISQTIPSHLGADSSKKKDKKVRKLQRKQLLLLSSSLYDPPGLSGSVTSLPPQVTISVGSGHSQSRYAHLLKA